MYTTPMLYEFYGTDCPHCMNMKPLIERLEKEEGVHLESKEVWHDKENQKVMESFDTGLCGGVPFFYNTETKNFLCGEVDYEDLRVWAVGKK
jgi:thiol-disulfide isomerase/thioredoxin